MQLTTLNQKHFNFVDAWDGGNDVDAMRIAGFMGADNYLKQQAQILLKEPLIQKAIQDRAVMRAKQANAVAGREEIQGFWTSVMRNSEPNRKTEKDPVTLAEIPETNIPLMTRLKASEHLAKSEGMFIDKVDMTVQHSLHDIIAQSYTKKGAPDDMDVEAIEAEYKRLQDADQMPAFSIKETPPSVSALMGDLL